MAVGLNIALDLGSDTLKVAYAYDSAGGVHYGKLSRRGLPTEVAIPAIAHYDQTTREWRFGYDVDRSKGASFVTVVKIKYLLDLLSAVPSRGDAQAAYAVRESNAKYYRDGKMFPKFYFPVSKDMLSDFGEMVESKMTFEADKTPREVCMAFFDHVAELVKTRIKKLQKKMQDDNAKLFASMKYVRPAFDKVINLAVVFPSGATKEYQAELVRLAEEAFDTEVNKKLSSTKALSIYAQHRGAIGKSESALVFDLGETDISVTRANVDSRGNLVVDGADGHSEPCKIGGNDVDRAIAAYIESEINDRETMGTPSFGEEGHLVERGLRERQYLLMKDIKKAKILLSLPECDNIFPDGVPLSMVRDLRIQRKFTRDELKTSIGLGSDAGVANEIVDYIVGELKAGINHDIKKIIISGGLAETFGLLEYIRAAVDSVRKGVRIITFDDYNDSKDDFAIGPYEDSTYAAAVGAAITMLKDIDVKTCLSLSYATWVTRGNEKSKMLSWIANKGDLLNEYGDNIYLGDNCNFGFSAKDQFAGVDSDYAIEEIRGDEIYSLVISEDQVKKIAEAHHDIKTTIGTGSETDKEKVFVYINQYGNPKQSIARRRALEKHFGLKTVSGGEDSSIYFYHKGRRVRLLKGRLYANEGVLVDEDGRSKPIIRNNHIANAGERVFINYQWGSLPGRWAQKAFDVPAVEIEMRFEGMDDFDIAGE